MKQVNWIQLLLFTFLNCIAISAVLFIVFKKPRVTKMTKAEFVNFQDSFANFKLGFEVDNPNFFSISGKNGAIRFMNKDEQLGEGEIQPFCVRKMSSSSLDMTVKINFRRLFNSYNERTSDSITPAVVIRGSFMPFFFAHEFRLEKKILKTQVTNLVLDAFKGEKAIQVDSFSISKVSASRSDVAFQVLFTNNFDFDFSIEEIFAELYIPGHDSKILGNASVKQNMLLASKQTAHIPVQLSIDNLSAVLLLLNRSVKNANPLFVKGETKIKMGGEHLVVPFDIPLEKKGAMPNE